MLYRVLGLERPSLSLLRRQDVALRVLTFLGKYRVLGTSLLRGADIFRPGHQIPNARGT